MYIFADDIKRLGYTQNAILNDTGLAANFQIVKCTEKFDNRSLICIEQRRAELYGRHGVDLTTSVVAKIKPHLWATVGSSPPYRRYYLYVCPAAERASVVPQFASIYALAFYLGSVTRYRPNTFSDLLDGAFGPRVSELIAGQPGQFVYLMASEFARRDVTRPSIV